MKSKNSLFILHSRGFTLVEILFAVTIGLLLLSAIYVAIQSGQRSSVAIEAKTAAQQDVRAALELMALEIGMASYNPLFRQDPAFWVTNTCANSPNQNYKGIQEATANAITVEMVTADGSWIGDDPNEVIRYNYDAANQFITRQTNCAGGAQPFLGASPQSGLPRTVRVINNTLGINMFRYFDGRGNEIATLPAGIPNIRRIDITLAVETDSIDPNTGQRRRMIYSTSVIPRNHAISP